MAEIKEKEWAVLVQDHGPYKKGDVFYITRVWSDYIDGIHVITKFHDTTVVSLLLDFIRFIKVMILELLDAPRSVSLHSAYKQGKLMPQAKAISFLKEEKLNKEVDAWLK